MYVKICIDVVSLIPNIPNLFFLFFLGKSDKKCINFIDLFIYFLSCFSV